MYPDRGFGPMVSASHFKDRRVLVTGASGFIGADLVESLILLGARVYVMSQTVDFRRPLFGNAAAGDSPNDPLAWEVEKVIHADLRNWEDCRHAVAVSEPYFVFHLGALTQVPEAAFTPVEAFRVNALGTVNLLDACRQIVPTARIIVASSDKSYGQARSGTLPFTEDTALNPIHPYDLSKACGDMAARGMARHYGLILQITRMANVYGPGDTNWRRLIPGVLRDILEGRGPVIRSNGELVRQYLYITDATMALLLLAQGFATKKLPNASAWNLGPEERHSVMQVVEAIAEVMRADGLPVPDPIIEGGAEDETELLWMDSARALKWLGWSARTSLADGLGHTYKFVRRYLRMELDQYQP